MYRYNPGIIAQAFSSLDVLYPGRIGLGIGTGEAMNEVPLGFDWPEARIRLERTKEAIQIINKLWKKEHRREISTTTTTTTISGAGEKDEKHQSTGLNARGNNDSSGNFDGKVL